MMPGDKYFYNATIRKTVAVFGSVFNNIYTGKQVNGKLTQVARVPISYGPHKRFLTRINTSENIDNPDVAVKLPRMSFEITSISYDPTAKLNRNNTRQFDIDGNNDEKIRVRQSVPYIIGMQLSILTDNQDTGLQVLEQIIPNFNPEYTLSVKDMEGPGSRSDMPIILNSVALQDDYEGDFEAGRRTIIYTLEFSIKVRFIGSIGERSKIIKDVTVQMITGDPCDDETVPSSRIHVTLGDPINDTPENYTVITTFGFDGNEESDDNED
jgi:hypothetical protein